MLQKHWGTLVFLLIVTILGSLFFHWVHVARSATFQVQTDNTLRRYMGQDPDSLNPILRTDVLSSWVMDYIHHYIGEWDYKKNEIRPVLATHWDISDDGLDYIIHLRTDIRWHDNEPFDADDAVYSFQTIMDPEVPVGFVRASYSDSLVRFTLPVCDVKDQVIGATEFLELDLTTLQNISQSPKMDGIAEDSATVVASSGEMTLRAARHGDFLYLSGPIVPNHDSIFFLSNKPGKPGDETLFSPLCRISSFDRFFAYDCNNYLPIPTGWSMVAGATPESGTFAIGTNNVECMIDLNDAYKDGIPEKLNVVLCIMDDCQMEKIDQHTLKFHYPSKNYSHLDHSVSLRLVPEHYYNNGEVFKDHSKLDEPIGLGPYKFVKWERNNSITVQRWDDYWGERKPKIERIEFKIVGDPVVAYQVFKKGDIDLIDVGTWTFSQKAKGEEFDKYFRKISFDRPGYSYINWNNRRSFFSDARCRRAMSHLLDLETICKCMYLGLRKPTTGTFFYKEPSYDKSLPNYEYNIEEAARLLDEAGWLYSATEGVRVKDINGDGIIEDGTDENMRERFEFEFLIPSSGADAQNSWAALSLIQNCRKVNINCKMRAVEWAVFLGWTHEHKFDSYIAGWVNGFESDPYGLYHTSQIKDGNNRGGYRSLEMDALMETAREELDKEKRTELFRQLHRMEWEEQPYTYLLGSTSLWLVNKRVKNIHTYGLGFDFLEWELHSVGDVGL
jgi:ABC-type transport system substrate-binding protein